MVAAVVAALLPRGADAAPASARLTPAAFDVRLASGQSRTVDLNLLLPPEPPRPTDLYLLVDTSAGMRSHLPSLRRGLRDALAPLASRQTLVGVGEFRTTSVADWHDGLTYRALRRVGPVNSDLAAAVDSLGRTEATLPQAPPGERAHTLALDEAVTGDGSWPYTRPGQDAGFRRGVRTVVVLVTDAAFVADRAQPARTDAVATLRAAGVEVFGLAVGSAALSDLTAVAAGTGSVTETTVDCGAGRRVAAGRPTACVVSPAAIGGALRGMLYERRRGTVTVSATGTGVRRLTPRVVSVDRNVASRLRFRLEIGCAANDGGRTHRITLAVSVSGTKAANAFVTARCHAR